MRKLIKLSLVVSLCVSLVACAQPTKPENKTPDKITIVDQAGREVTFDKPAEKVASGYYIVTSTMLGLGLKEQLVGVEMKAETRPIYTKVDEKIASLPALGNKKMFNVEECAKLNPDVVFLPMGLKDYVSKLEALDIKVVLLNPETQADFEKAVELIATICGVKDRADDYFDYRDDLFATYLKKQAASDVNVYFAGSSILEAASQGMFQSEIIQSVFAKNVVSGNENNWVNVNVETLLASNPDYIFLENGGARLDDVKNEVALQNVKALMNDQVHVFPSALETWDTPSLSYCLGTLWMYATLYPEALSMEDVEREAKAFYQEFFTITVSAEELGL